MEPNVDKDGCILRMIAEMRGEIESLRESSDTVARSYYEIQREKEKTGHLLTVAENQARILRADLASQRVEEERLRAALKSAEESVVTAVHQLADERSERRFEAGVLYRLAKKVRPWPLSDHERESVNDYLNRLASQHGYDGWEDAHDKIYSGTDTE
jgi:hypothetical protein